MSAFLKRIWLVVLLFPLASYADPVQVTTHYKGTVQSPRYDFPALGIDLRDSLADVPFDITVSSLLDTSLPGADRLGVLEAPGADLSATITIAGQTFNYSGPSLRTYAGSSGINYMHWIELDLGGSWLTLYSITGNRPVGVRGLPLVPRYLDTNTGPGAWSSFELSYTTELDGQLVGSSMIGGADFFSLQVVSAVPEPAQGKLALAGLLVLGACAGMRRRAPHARLRVQDKRA